MLKMVSQCQKIPQYSKSRTNRMLPCPRSAFRHERQRSYGEQKRRVERKNCCPDSQDKNDKVQDMVRFAKMKKSQLSNNAYQTVEAIQAECGIKENFLRHW